MNPSPPAARTERRFGNARVLWVIFFAVLVLGALFPAVQSGDRPHPKAWAKGHELNIAAAIKTYFTEYGEYPLGANATAPGSKPGVFIYGQSSTSPSRGSGVSNAQLFDILRNIDSTGATAPDQPNRYNPRGIVFFDAGTVKDEMHPRSGFIPQNTKGPGHPGAFVDPWGTEYFIVIDAGGNGELMGLPYKDFQGLSAPKVSVGVFSLGEDQKLGHGEDGYYKNPKTGAPSDDVISWN